MLAEYVRVGMMAFGLLFVGGMSVIAIGLTLFAMAQYVRADFFNADVQDEFLIKHGQLAWIIVLGFGTMLGLGFIGVEVFGL